MGSLIVKLDDNTKGKLKNQRHYSDVDVLGYRSRSDELPMVYDVDAVKVSIRNILMWRVGESVLRPEFGHNIHRSMYEQINEFNQDKLCEEIKRAIEVNEPRAEVVSVALKTDDIEQDKENSTLGVRVVYRVIGDKTEGA